MSNGPRRSTRFFGGVAVFVLVLLLAASAFPQEGGGRAGQGAPALVNGKPGMPADPDAPAPANAKTNHKDDPRARAEWFMLGRQIKGENTAFLLQRAYRQKLKIRQKWQLQMQQSIQMQGAAGAQGNSTPSAIVGVTPSTIPFSNPSWQALGPAPITGMGNVGNASGRISAVAFDQTDATGNTVLVGGAYGGVWRSTNAAAADPTTVTWTPLYDTDPNASSLAVGAISLQPGNHNIILVGTGEPTNSLLSYYGNGILRSTDNGASWTSITSGDSGSHSFFGMGVAKFAWSTQNTSVVVAALSTGTIAKDFTNATSGTPGVYYSTDAGASWHLASNGGNWNDIDDVVYSPAANKFFAFAGQRPGFGNIGVYISSDGQTWSFLAAQPGSIASAFRGQLAVRPDTGELYASWVDGNDSLGGVFRSTNNGGSWTTLTAAGNGISSCGDSAACDGYQGFYNQYVMAVPNGSATDIYFGAGNVFKCSATTSQTCNATSGTTNKWLNLTHVYGSCDASYTTIHPDQHTADYLAADPNHLVFGNDGGAYRTLSSQSGGMASGACATAGTSNAFDDINTHTLGSLSQFISFSQHPTDDTILLGGTQDNGSPGFSTDQPNPLIFPEWYEAWGGDGGFNAIDQTNPQNWYAANTDVSIFKCLDGTGCLESAPFCNGSTTTCNPVVDNSKVGSDGGAFYTPYILDPADQSQIIVATCRIWRGTANGVALTKLGNGSGLTGATLSGHCPVNSSQSNYFRTIVAGGPVVNGVSSVIYGGGIGGKIFVSTNAGVSPASNVTWTDRTSGANPGLFPIGGFAIDPGVATGQTAYVAIMGFTGNPDGSGHLFKTTNAGQSWTDVGVGLPDAPADAVAVDPRDSNVIYVGTDVGVFATNDGGTTWAEYGTGLPNVTPMVMRIFNNGATMWLRVSTHGRGVWQAALMGQNDFSIGPSNPVATIRPGQTAHWSMTVQRGGSFASVVALSCNPDPPVPAGSTCNLAPTSADLSANTSVPVTLDVPTSGGTTTGDYAFNVHGSGGGVNHDAALTLRVNDFAIGSATTPQTIQQTSSGTYTVTITPSGNFSDPVTLSCANFTSAGMSCQFSQNPVTPGLAATPVTVTVNAAANAPVASNQTFDVVATGDGTQHSVSLGYNVILVQDFTFDGFTVTQTVLAGNTANFSGTLTPLNSFSANNLTLGCTNLPAGASCQFNPAAPSISSQTPQGLAINVLTTAGTTPVGQSNITVTATDAVSGKTHSIQVSLTVQDLSITVSAPSTRTIPIGAGTTYTVSVKGLNGYNNLVTLGCGTLPANVSCDSFNPPVLTPSAGGVPSVVTVLTTPSVTTGAKTVPFTVTADGQVRTASGTLNISSTAAAFSMTPSPASKTIAIGASTTYTVNVKQTTTTSPGVVTLSCVPPLPDGVSCSFSPPSVSPTSTGVNSTLTVTTTVATPAASYPITLQGTTSSQLKRGSVTLQVTDFTLGVAPSNQIINPPGGQTTYTATLTAVNGFNTPVTLNCTGLPAGWGCNFNPPSPTPTAVGATSTLTLTTTSTPFGPTIVNVNATAGSLVRSQQVTVTNGANDYAIGLASGTALVAVRPGQTANWSLQLSRFGTFSASVAESCVYTSSTPAGVACNIAPNPADLTSGTCPANGVCQSPTLAIPTNANTTAIGDYPLNFHGNGGGSQHDLPLTLRVNDFSIGSATAPQTIQQAASATYNVTVTSLNNYGGTVTLSCANFTSSGMSCQFSSNNFVPSAAGTPVTVTVSAAGNATVANNQTFDVVAGDGTTSHSVNRGYSTILVQDFTYSNSTVATQTVVPGQQANYSTTLTPLNAFSANVNLVCSGLPANTTCSFSPVSPVSIGSATPKPVTVTINTTSTTPAGNATITVTATDPVSGKTHAVNNLSLSVQSFTLSVTPTARTIRADSGTTFSVTVNAQNGLTQPVTLSCPAAPAGLTCVPPAPITPGTSGTMTVLASSSITAGAKTLAISGTTGAGLPIVNQNVTVTISTTAASFTITNSAPTKSVAVGSSVNYSLVVKSASTLSPGAVTLSCVPPLPTGVTCTFSPASLSPTTTGTTVTATVHTTSSTPAQSFALQFRGATTSQFKTSNFTLNVGDYTLGVTPPTQTISSASGGSTQYTVTLTSIDAFSTSTALSCTGLPAGWSCGFAPASVTPTGAGATSTLTLTTTNSPLGPTSFTVQGSGGGVIHTQQVQVINGQDFTLANGGPITVQQGNSNTVQINATAIGTFSSSVALSCPGLQAGFSCGFVPTSINPGTPSTLTVGATGAVAGGQYQIAVQGQSSSPSLTHTTNVTVNVPDFSVGLTGNANVVIRGGSLPLSGTAASLGGFATSTTFNCSTGDANAPCVAASPVTPTVGGAAIAVTVSPNGSATLGAHTVTLTGNDGAGHVHSATFGITVQDFSVAATDLNATVEAGATTGSYSGTVTGLGGFTGNVTMSCTSTITLVCAFTPNPVTASGAGTGYTFTITPDPAAAIGGPYAVTVKGTDASGAFRTATVHVTVTATQDWSYAYQGGTPQTQTVNAGQSATYNINLSPNNGFNSSVALTCSVTGAPAGVGCGITGSPVAGGSGAITLTVTTTVGTVAPGSYSIVVSGTGGGKTRTTTATLNVKDFTLSAGPSPQTVAPGATADYTVSISSASFPASPTLSCQILTAPAGTSCSFDSTTVAPGGSTLMHVSSTNGTTPSGSYTVQVTATSGSTVHTANVTYTVQSLNGFTITTSTPTKTVTAGTSAVYSVTVTATGTFASSVTLSCSGIPTGTNCLVPASFFPGTSGITKSVSLLTSSSSAKGTFNFNIVATGGGLTQSVQVQVTIQ